MTRYIECEACGGTGHDIEDHEVLGNLHMYLRTPIELIDDVLATAESILLGIENREGIGADNLGRRAYDQRMILWQVREVEVVPLTEDEREDMDIIEDINRMIESPSGLSRDPAIHIMWDGACSGDVLFLDVIEDRDDCALTSHGIETIIEKLSHAASEDAQNLRDRVEESQDEDYLYLSEDEQSTVIELILNRLDEIAQMMAMTQDEDPDRPGLIDESRSLIEDIEELRTECVAFVDADLLALIGR